MSTQTTPASAEATTTDKPRKGRRERRSFSVRLDGSGGAQARVTAFRRKDGTAHTHVVHTTLAGKKKLNQRGATEEHASIESARARVDELVSQLVKAGWKMREPRGGFARKPDAFDAAHLPGPGTAAVSKKK